MSEHEVIAEPKRVNFAATGVEEVLQNVWMILATPMFSASMDRDFAWNPNVDAPMNVAQARISAGIVAAIQRYEPRAQVVSVSFQGEGINGILKPVVRVGVDDGAV